MLVIRGSELYKHEIHPGTDPWHWLPGRDGDDNDTSFVARTADFIVDSVCAAINLYGAPGGPARRAHAVSAGAPPVDMMVPLENDLPLLQEGTVDGVAKSFGYEKEKRKLLPLDVAVPNFGPPPYVDVCSDKYRAWLMEENSWYTRELADWFDSQYLHIPWDA